MLSFPTTDYQFGDRWVSGDRIGKAFKKKMFKSLS